MLPLIVLGDGELGEDIREAENSGKYVGSLSVPP